MRQHPRAQSDGDALRAEQQEERQLGRERDGFLIASVVAGDRLGEFVVENLVAREVGQAALDVARGRRRVARVDVAEVPLPFDEVAFLLQHHERVGDGSVAVRMELHRVTDDVGHLDELAVVVFVQGVHDAPLHRLEAVFQRGNGPVADDVARVGQEILVHQRPEGRIVRRRGMNHVGGAVRRQPGGGVLRTGVWNGVGGDQTIGRERMARGVAVAVDGVLTGKAERKIVVGAVGRHRASRHFEPGKSERQPG